MKTDAAMLKSARVVILATGFLQDQAPGTDAIAGTVAHPSGSVAATPEGGFRLSLLPPGNDAMAVEEQAKTRSLALGRVRDQSLINALPRANRNFRQILAEQRSRAEQRFCGRE